MTDTSWTARSDADLLGEFVARRCQPAFAEIVRRHGGMVLSVCRSVLGTTADAEDAAQAVFLTLAQKAGTCHARTALVGWLHRVAWYVAARAAEARAIRRRHEQEAARMNAAFPAPPSSADPAEPVIPLESLHAGLAALPEKYRIPLLLHHLEGRTQEETAALLGCGLSAVAMRLNRGRQLLRERLAKRGLAPSAAGVAAAFAAQPLVQASPIFIAGTAHTATAAITGSLLTTSMISGSTMALSKGAMTMLFWAKVKTIAVVCSVLLILGGTVSTVLLAQTGTTPPPTQIAGGGNITALDATSVTITRGDKAVTVTINAQTVIKLDGKVVTRADLKTGLYAMAFGTGTTASEIRAYTPKPAPPPPAPKAAPIAGGGFITALDANSVTITRNNVATTVTVNAATVYKLDDQIVTLADLKIGLYAGAWGTGTTASEIRAYTPKPAPTQPAPAPTPNVAGTIAAIGAGSVTIQPKTGNAVVVSLNDATVVKVGGKVATAGDLKVGMNAYAFVTTGRPATEIRAYLPASK